MEITNCEANQPVYHGSFGKLSKEIHTHTEGMEKRGLVRLFSPSGNSFGSHSYTSSAHFDQKMSWVRT